MGRRLARQILQSRNPALRLFWMQHLKASRALLRFRPAVPLHPHPQEMGCTPASKESIGWTGIIAIAAVFSIQLGAIYWLNNNMQAGFESVNEEFGRVYEEFGRVRDEISDLRNHTLAEISDLRNHTLAEIGSIRAEIGLLRSEVGELGERMTRLEMLTQDRLPSAP